MKNLKERILQQLADGLGDGEDYTEFIDMFFDIDEEEFEDTLLQFTLMFAVEAKLSSIRIGQEEGNDETIS